MSEGVRVRTATVPELPDVLNVLDGAALAVDTGRLRSRLDRDDVLVAVAGSDDRVLGALVLDGEEITAIAVRRRRRDQGVGTRLVEASASRRERLRAEFDADARPFWEAVGFEIEPIEGTDRYRAVRER